MIAKIRDNVLLKSALLCTLVVALLFGSFALTNVAFADDDDSDYTFYKVSSAATAFYDDAHNPKSSTNFWSDDDLTMDMAGMFVGFLDEDYDSGLIGSTISFLSSSSQSRSYTSLEESAVYEYAVYGHALASLGLDSTANESFDFMAIVRFFAGILLILFYTAALTADLFFAVALIILQTLNPFSWFVNGVTWVSSSFANWMGDVPDTPAALDGLASMLSEWYAALYNLGFYVIVFMFIVGLAAALLFWKNQQYSVGGAIRKFATRAAFVCLGVPLLGMLYTMSLNAAVDLIDADDSTPTANTIIASTIVDFEAWAENNHLALPNGTTLVVDTSSSSAGAVDIGSSTSLRTLARAINYASGTGLVDSAGIGDLLSDDWTLELETTSSSNSSSYLSSVFTVYDLIGRFMNSTFYTASSFETTYKSTHQSDDVYSLIETASDWSNYENGTSSISGSFISDGSASSFDATSTYTGSDITLITYTGSGSQAGLSSLSLYNYLNTVFDDSSVTTYSSTKLTASLSRYSHHSANLIGNGFSSVLYYFNAMSMLIAISVIALVYAIGLVINVLSRGIKMCTSVPFAMLGNLRSMAKICTYTAMMVIEILGTFFVYSIIVELIMSFSSIIETPLLNYTSSGITSTIELGGMSLLGLSATSGAFSGIFTYIGLVVSSIFYLWFSFKAIKLRKSIIKTIDETAAGYIDKLFVSEGAGMGVATAPTTGEKASQAMRGLAGGAAAGAAAGLGHMAAGKLADKMSSEGTEGTVSTDEATAEVDGGAENASGTEVEDSGGAIEGADRQQLTAGDGASGDGGSDPKGLSPGDDSDGKAILDANVDSLGDVKSVSSGDEVSSDTTSAETVSDEHSGASTSQLATDADMDSAMGKTSAMDEVRDEEAASEMRKAGIKKAAEGTVETAEGVAKVATAASTGDVKTGVDGVTDVVSGTSKMKEGADKAANASERVAAQRAQKNERKTLEKNAVQQQNGAASGGSPQPQQPQQQSSSGSQPQASNNSQQSSSNNSSGGKKSLKTNYHGLSAQDVAVMTAVNTSAQNLRKTFEKKDGSDVEDRL